MNIRKTIWIPVVFGAAFGLVVVLADVAGFTIPTPSSNADSREIFNTICSALGGPLAVLVLLIIENFLNPVMAGLMGTWDRILILNFIPHVLSGLWMVFAYKLIYERIKSQPFAYLAWIGSILVYYYMILIPVNFLLDKPPDIPVIDVFILPMILPPAIHIEVGITILITTLIWVAVPRRYRRPLAYALKKDFLDQNG